MCVSDVVPRLPQVHMRTQILQGALGWVILGAREERKPVTWGSRGIYGRVIHGNHVAYMVA